MGLSRLNGIQPEVGTIIGGNRYRAPMVVIAVDETGCWLRTASPIDVPALTVPRSLMEFKLIPRRHSVFGLIRKLSVR